MNDAAVSGGRVVRCPGCGGESVYAPSNPHRPFCCARCKNSDFGAWASEAYRVSPAQADDDTEEGTSDPQES